MKKFLIGAVVGSLALMGFAVPAMATKPDPDSGLVNGHKVFICHNVAHNPVIVLVDVASVDANNGDLKGGHGNWPDTNDLTSFVPHGSPGHNLDFLFLADAKPAECPSDVTACIGGDTVVVDKSEALLLPADTQTGECPPVTAYACLSGTITAFGPGDPADVDAALAAYLAANAGSTEVDSADSECLIPEVPEVPETPVNPETPGTPVTDGPAAPVAPVVDAPVAPGIRTAPKPVALPHTL